MSNNGTKQKKLTPKEIIFCNVYLTNFNGSKSAIKAGYSKNAAAETAYELLRKPHIKKYIKEKTEEILTEVGVNQLMVVRELAKIAFFNPKRVFHKNGTLKSLHEMDNNTSSVISAIDVNETVIADGDAPPVTSRLKKMKFVSKEAALTNLMKYLGLAQDKVDVTTKGKELPSSERVIEAILNL